jgi:predicted MPP superfamily phosphohydrolase
VLLAGDYVIKGVLGGSFVAPEDIASRLRELHAPLGVYAVLGNHDWWFDAPRVRDALRVAGIPTLDDAAHSVDGPRHFWLAGVSDFWEGSHDVHRALAGVTDDAPVILFTHNPDVFPHVPARVALTIAGHTHGGQVCLPLVGRPIVPSRFGQRYAIGHVVEDGRHLFVSPGLGTSIIPVRFRVPPEISLVTLRAP